jgi:3-oxoacid CoA-transferase A subunit
VPPDKVFPSIDEAVADIPDGAVVMIAGLALPGTPQALVKALMGKGSRDLTCISGPWHSKDPELYDAASLVANGQVRKVITPGPIHPDAHADAHDSAARMWQEGRLEAEIVPQGTLAERIRAGGAGIGGLLLPTGRGTGFAEGKEKQMINGREYILETGLKADFALLRAHKADTLGNLIYQRSQRNWNPIMAMAADVTIVEVGEIVQPGELDPELVITPGIYVDRIVKAQQNV